MRSNRRGRWKQLALRLPVQAIYKFDDRRIVAGPHRIRQPQRRRRDRHHAGRQDREDQDRRELAGDAGQGQPDRRPLGRHHARPRTVHRARRRHRPCRRTARAIRAGFARGFSGCTTSRWRRATRSWSGSARARPAPPWSRSRRRSIPANSPASRPSRSRATMSARSTSRWRSRSRPIPTPTIRAPDAW